MEIFNVDTLPYWISAVAIVALLVYLITWGDFPEILKDGPPSKKYSFSKTQMFFWSAIFFISLYAIAFYCTPDPAQKDGKATCHYGKLPDLSAEKQRNLFILLGLSFGTALAGISIKPKMENLEGKSEPGESQGLILDILSDATGLQIHRFQCAIFNLIYGSSFLCTAITQHQFMDITDFQLGLMTISSSGYILLKFKEANKASKR